MAIDGNRYYVPCGKCNFCLQNKRNDWSYRLAYELKHSMNGNFLTLTYDSEHLPLTTYDTSPAWARGTYMTLNKPDLIQFIRSTRNAQTRMLSRFVKRKQMTKAEAKKWKIKYYAVGEYGTKQHRPHYHIIIFNLHPRMQRNIDRSLWTKGQTHWGEVNVKSIQYTTKYVIDKPIAKEVGENDPRPRPFAIMSKHLGEIYIDKRTAWHKANAALYVRDGERKMRMPRYYKDRIFTEEERKELGEIASREQEEFETQKVNSYLEQFNGDRQAAIEHYWESVKYRHDQIRIKSHNSNKF